MLEIDPRRAAQAIPQEDSGAQIGEPVEIEVLALASLDLVALAVEPPDPPAACEEQGAGAALVPPLHDAGGGSSQEMMLRPGHDGFTEQAEPVANDEVAAE